MTRILGWLLGLENVTAIDEIDPSLAASWAQEGPFWVFLGAVALVVVAVVFYVRFQPRGSLNAKVALGVSRGLLLALLFITLADPVLRLTVTNEQRPYLYVVFDGTDSMAIEDELPQAQRTALAQAVGLKNETKPPPAPSKPISKSEPAERPSSYTRMDYVQALHRKEENNLLARLQEENKVQLEAFVFDGNTTSQLRKLKLNSAGSDKV